MRHWRETPGVVAIIYDTPLIQIHICPVFEYTAEHLSNQETKHEIPELSSVVSLQKKTRKLPRVDNNLSSPEGTLQTSEIDVRNTIRVYIYLRLPFKGKPIKPNHAVTS